LNADTRQLDVIVVGELNADLILTGIPSLPEIGKEKIVQGMTLTMGSASAILATNIARLGINVGFIGQLGRDSFGDLVQDTLINRGVDTSGIFVNPDVRTGITVVMSFPDDYAMLTYMGAMQSFSLEDVDFTYLLSAKHMHMSSYYLQPGLRPGFLDLFRRCKEAGLTTSLDPGWDPEEKWEKDIFDIMRHVDVMLPNEQEALFITGAPTLEDALQKLNEYAKTVIIKRGSRGALGISDGRRIGTKAFPVKVIDTTGSGDSFNSGFLYQWLRKGDLKECMIYGSACGAIAATKMGGSTASPNLKELQQFLNQHWKYNIVQE
jgi:sugar/nucleoside kinase (ribokinase family)